ncbi:MAG: dihydroorotase [Bacteroidota bacterium]|nr:dihydroorotase [Bacteroidota bacterium]
MKILLRKVLIADNTSSFNGLQKDIFLVNGTIASIEDSLSTEADIIIEENGMVVSPGWIDPFAQLSDPGFEYRETIASGAAAAAAGGYTQVFAVPNTSPMVQSKTQVEYILSASRHLPTTVLPLGAVTKNIEGKDLAEMYDMHNSGAIAFSDGLQPVQTSGLLLKALQYVKAFDGVVIQLPIDKSIGTHGLINEGIVSTRLGLPGIPSIAEEIIIKRDIDLLRYTESKLHITGVSTAKGIELIQKAKQEGLQISSSVTPYHLYFCDENIQQYDTNLKVPTPLRTKEDRQALQNAVLNGVVDCIASHHIPHDIDSKICEFEYAKPGMLGLQTAFAVVHHVLPQLSPAQIAQLFSVSTRNIFNLPYTIKEGAAAELTLFNLQKETTLNKQNNKSKSVNSPFFNISLKGAVRGIFSKGQLTLNEWNGN